ncbi:hypothetical protein Q0M94_19250 (plasmid) [Deinococcus radiomollis]|uniref:hypothetical protein n=1 Tax=Deinococcus radiomollis TaxID=468916 RepID=UPI00389293A0
MTARKKYTEEELFSLYVSMGDTRTLQGLAGITGYSLPTLNNRSSKGKWQKRLKAQTEEQRNLVSAFVADINSKNLITESIVYSGLGERILQVLKDSLPLLEASKNPKDLKTLLDIYRVINSQPTEISEVYTKTLQEEDYSSLSDAELELLNKLSVN